MKLMRKLPDFKFVLTLITALAAFSCVEKNENSITSFINEAGVNLEPNEGEVGDTLFILQTPVWGPNPDRPAFDYPFNQPGDVYVGREPLVYIADTGNDRIYMLDTFGNIQGILEGIRNPVDMVQDPRLRLYIVNETSTIYFVDLFKYRHDFGKAQIDSIYGASQLDNDCDFPLSAGNCWKFVGISMYVNDNGEDEIYIASTGPRQKNRMIHQFSPDTSRTDPYKGPLPLVSGGLGFFGVTDPTGITGVQGRRVDFVYTQKGLNSFKVQWITDGGETSAFSAFLNPSLGFDLFQTNFREPEDVSVDENLNVYVVDAAADSMYKYSNFGDLLQTLGPVNPESKRLDMSVVLSDSAYIDSLSGIPVLQNSVDILSVLSTDTTLLLTDNGRGGFEGWAGSGAVNYDTGVFDIAFNDSMRSVTSDGSTLVINYLVKGLNNPRGVSVFDKIVYIADTGNNRIVRYKLSTDID